MSLALIALMLADAAAGGAAGPVGAPLTVTVSGVRNAKGRVHVALCPRDRFLSENCPYEASAPATKGVTVVTFPAVVAGDYAAQSFHDENGNQKMDRLFGKIPKEGFGFSRDAKVRFSPPAWNDAVFNHPATAQTIHFGLRYMIGGE